MSIVVRELQEHVVELRLDRPGGSDFIWSFVCPVDDETSMWWMVHAYPLGGDAEAIEGARALQAQVGVEDLWMLEQMEDPTVPLDVRTEVHTRADLGCLEYRRMLIDIAALAAPAHTTEPDPVDVMVGARGPRP